LASAARLPPLSLHDALPISCYEADLTRLGGELVGGAPCDARRLEVDLSHQVFGAVVGLRRIVRGERVRLDDVRARIEIGAVNRADRKSTRLNSSHVKISYAV